MRVSKAVRWGRQFILPTLLIAVISGTPDPTLAAVIPNDEDVASLNTSYSYNWSGYAATAASGQTFASVSGSWTVPSVTSTTSGNTYSCHWIGLDGDGSTTVEQIGTEADVINGTPTYYAWYEFAPAAEVEISGFAIQPGDQMSATVEYDGATTSKSGSTEYGYTMTLYDARTKSGTSLGELYTTTDAALASAEWIAEAPTLIVRGKDKLSTLADFGSVTFTGADAALDGGASTPISGFTTNTAIDMVNAAGTAIIADTSSLNGTGDGFTVTVVPEPSTIVLLGTAAIGLLIYAWGRRK